MENKSRRIKGMKKLLMGLLAVGLVLAWTMPAMAFDSQFGGYWRTRAYVQKNFTGSDSGDQDVQQVDTRTRLYYTAVFSENFKFVNKFEWNVTWGDKVGGKIGTDGMGIFRIKHSFADFNAGPVNFKIGLQGATLLRGFLFDDDFAGAVVTFKGSGVSVPIYWIKAYEGGYGNEANDNDVDYYVVSPTFTFGNTTLTPTLAYIYSSDASKWTATYVTNPFKETKIWIAGVDGSTKIGGGSLNFTAIYEGGEAEWAANPAVTADLAAYVLALGASFPIGPMDVHGEVFYASGDKDSADNDYEAYYVPRGRSYYWAEIMGYGTIDNQVSANACADQISNIFAANIGVGFKVSDKTKLSADLWHAKLAENNAAGDDLLGTEIDLKLTHKLATNIAIDLGAAYLFAGDATYKGDNQKDPYELYTRLSFGF
jgi:hypothetical protein